jgi:hypothetical protein
MKHLQHTLKSLAYYRSGHALACGPTTDHSLAYRRQRSHQPSRLWPVSSFHGDDGFSEIVAEFSICSSPTTTNLSACLMDPS